MSEGMESLKVFMTKSGFAPENSSAIYGSPNAITPASAFFFFALPPQHRGQY
jgi:hypothetical protein